MNSKPKKQLFSTQTRNNLLLDLTLFSAALLAALSGIYFLFFPTGGYQGGRNPIYGIQILFERHTWNDIHTWASVAFISLAALHIPLHWDWIIKMTRSAFRSLTGKTRLNRPSQFNLGINILIGLSGLICGISGVYFLLVPAAHGSSLVAAQTLIFAPQTWDLIHTWSGVALIAAAMLHINIHWKWIAKIVLKYWKNLVGSSSGEQADQRPAVAGENL